MKVPKWFHRWIRPSVLQKLMTVDDWLEDVLIYKIAYRAYLKGRRDEKKKRGVK